MPYFMGRNFDSGRKVIENVDSEINGYFLESC